MRQSAGILLYRKPGPKVFLVHPGGPFWKNKDKGAWSIPKGEFTDDEPPLEAAVREFEEETGQPVSGSFHPLGLIRQKGGKQVEAWACEGDLDAETIVSNLVKIEWPYKSGKWQAFPEVDRAGWFTIEEAREKINPGQEPFLDRLTELLENRE
jgi:predicted NUDIX family NTP pyrophosphohydrolase